MSRRDRLHRRDAVLWTGTFSATPAFTCAPTVSTAWHFSPLLAQAAIQTPHDFSPQPHRTTAPCTIGQRQESWSVAGRTLHRRAGHFFLQKSSRSKRRSSQEAQERTSTVGAAKGQRSYSEPANKRARTVMHVLHEGAAAARGLRHTTYRVLLGRSVRSFRVRH